jgi:hypothetical protein
MAGSIDATVVLCRSVVMTYVMLVLITVAVRRGLRNLADSYRRNHANNKYG